VTRASPSRTRRRLQQKKLGRPEGSHVNLLRDPQRFFFAGWLAFTWMGLGPFVAGQLATVLIEEATPIAIEGIEGLLLAVSAPYASADSSGAVFDEHVRTMVRRCRLTIGRATDRECEWLARSAGAIEGLLGALALGDAAGADRALTLLDRDGWPEVIERVRTRCDTALRSNVPPFDLDRLRAAGRRLLDQARQQKRAENIRAISGL
jgi:hypothetical protein